MYQPIFLNFVLLNKNSTKLASLGKFIVTKKCVMSIQTNGLHFILLSCFPCSLAQSSHMCSGPTVCFATGRKSAKEGNELFHLCNAVKIGTAFQNVVNLIISVHWALITFRIKGNTYMNFDGLPATHWTFTDRISLQSAECTFWLWMQDARSESIFEEETFRPFLMATLRKDDSGICFDMSTTRVKGN